MIKFNAIFLAMIFCCAILPAKDISSVDKNFKIQGIDRFDGVYYDVKSAPLVLEGLPWFKANKEQFCRMPLDLQPPAVNKGIPVLTHQTAGVCVRFRTDSPVIVLRATLAHSQDMSHMTRAGSMGFDSYRKVNGEMVYCRTIMPRSGQKNVHALIGHNSSRKMMDWQINFPLYGGVSSVEIAVSKGSCIEKPTPHRIADPVLFYGSSITQGGCASRPGNVYTSMLCRKVDAPQINMGFSGSARGEEAIAKLIGKLKLSCFVYDYDHNAPTVKHLAATHEKFFRIVRKLQPTLPVIIMSRCNYKGNSHDLQRRAIIRKTYENAVAAGDKNVYWVDGKDLFQGDMRDSCTVDGTHPNDLGFFRMYAQTLPALKKALKITDQ